MMATSLLISVSWAWLSGSTGIVAPTFVKSSLASDVFRACSRTHPIMMTFTPKSIVRTLVVVVAIIVVSMIILVVIVVVMQGALTAALAVPIFRIEAVTPLLGDVTLVLIIIVPSMIRICNARRANVLVTPPPHAIS